MAAHPARGAAVAKLLDGNGQSTVEYALVLAALLAIALGLGALADVLGAGTFVQHALMSASHHIQAVAPGSLADVFAY